ncbi:MAG: prepilin-type N-terminal cleavage/methylation domain-containing protein [Planctomycetes bacterium]|nr:prepilin-type N-terminal cleavage/methylation domain-containing protein [Planctomycetota bacterium]
MVNQVRKAFTLIEILIVVIILGILAAIVVPQFTSATEEAQISNMQATLQTIRNQIELYRVRNNGQYPVFLIGVANGWGDPNGATAVLRGLRGVDYLRSNPVNPRTAGLAASEWGTMIIAGAVPSATDDAGFLRDPPTPLGGGEVYGARVDEDGIISGQQGTAQGLG